MHNTLSGITDKLKFKSLLTETATLFKQERGRYPTQNELIQVANTYVGLALSQIGVMDEQKFMSETNDFCQEIDSKFISVLSEQATRAIAKTVESIAKGLRTGVLSTALAHGEVSPKSVETVLPRNFPVQTVARTEPSISNPLADVITLPVKSATPEIKPDVVDAPVHYPIVVRTPDVIKIPGRPPVQGETSIIKAPKDTIKIKIPSETKSIVKAETPAEVKDVVKAKAQEIAQIKGEEPLQQKVKISDNGKPDEKIKRIPFPPDLGSETETVIIPGEEPNIPLSLAPEERYTARKRAGIYDPFRRRFTTAQSVVSESTKSALKQKILNEAGLFDLLKSSAGRQIAGAGLGAAGGYAASQTDLSRQFYNLFGKEKVSKEDWDTAMQDPKTKESVQKQLTPAMTMLGALGGHLSSIPTHIPRVAGELVGMEALPRLTGTRPESEKEKKEQSWLDWGKEKAAEVAGTYLGGSALTGLQNLTAGGIGKVLPKVGKGLRAPSLPTVGGSIGFVGGSDLAGKAAEALGFDPESHPWAHTGAQIVGGLVGDITGTAAQNAALRQLGIRAAPLLANPVTGVIAAGTALGAGTAYGINRALGGKEYANRMFEPETYSPSTWAGGAKHLLSKAGEAVGLGEYNPDVDPEYGQEQAKKREEQYRKRLAQQQAQQKPVTGSVQDIQSKLQGIQEGKLTPKESLHRRLTKQKYKVSYIQDGKKVEVFASSIRGVRRVVYGKKQYRVHNSSGSDVTGYFKKLLGK